MNQQLEKLIKRFAAIAVLLFVVRCLISWDDLVNNFMLYDICGFGGEAVSATMLLFLAYVNWLWRFNRACKTPVLKKHYKGTLVSSYDDKPRDVTLTIKQSLLTTNIIMLTAESKSCSIISSIDDFFEEKRLTYCYLNEPKAAVRDRSAIHYGTAILCIDNVEHIVGSYYTDRKTTGDMDLIPSQG